MYIYIPGNETDIRGLKIGGGIVERLPGKEVPTSSVLMCII